MFPPTGRIISLLWSGSWPSFRAPCYCLHTSGLQGHGGKISWGVRSLLNGASQCQQLTNKIKFTRKFFSNLNNYKGAPLDGHWLQLSCKRDQHKPLELWRKVPSLKGLFTIFLFSVRSNILISNGVWYSWFCPEGPINASNSKFLVFYFAPRDLDSQRHMGPRLAAQGTFTRSAGDLDLRRHRF